MQILCNMLHYLVSEGCLAAYSSAKGREVLLSSQIAVLRAALKALSRILGDLAQILSFKGERFFLSNSELTRVHACIPFDTLHKQWEMSHLV